MKRQLILVISRTMHDFWREAEHIFQDKLKEATISRSGGVIRFGEEREYRYISRLDSLRGLRGQVAFWGPVPSWAKEPEARDYIRVAEYDMGATDE